MKKIFTISLMLASISSFCQVGGMSVSPNGSQPAASAGLDVNFTNKGFLLPRLTQVQRDSISAPDFGLMILNTTTNCFNVWMGVTWKQLCGDCDFNTPVPGNNGPICEGQTLNLSCTTIQGATYQWSGPNGFTDTTQNPSIPNATAGASGSYSVQATLNGCTSQPQSTVATVNAIPQTPTASNNGPVCLGQSITLSATTIVGASYTWSGPNNFSDNSQNPVITNIQSNQAGNYSVIASVSGCNSAPGSTGIIVSTIPNTPGNISGTTAQTANASGQVYTIHAVSGATSYNWTVPAGASISANLDTTIIVSFGPLPAGAITVSASNTCGTSAPDTLNITVTQTFNAASTGYTGSTQSFTAPMNATYTIIAYGAAGGSSSTPGGYGASMQGDFNLTQGQVLTILAGQAGANPDEQGSGGGGGGSFVVLNGNPIIVAGGGGGGGNSYAGGPGVTGTTGGSSTGTNISTGGTANGAGTAGAGNYSGGSGGGATCCDGSYSNQNGGLGGGGGAGFSGNGGQGQNGPTLAYSYENGGAGGYQYNYYGTSSNSYGGYGGGGNGVSYDYQSGGGGGGGYTGGGGGSGVGIGGGGGGGGSYNSGANQVNNSGVQTGNGQVVITW